MPLRTPRRPVLAGLAALLLAAAIAAPAHAQWRRGGVDRDLSKSGSPLKAAFKDVVVEANKATVKVRAGDRDVALGTVVSADGYVLTKASELPTAGDATPAARPLVVVLRDGSERAAAVVGVAEDHDLALLKVDAAGLTPVVWADAKKAAVGQWVATTGAGDAPAALGVLSVGRRKIPPRSGLLGVRLADAANGSGAKVMQVESGSPAEKVGIQPDDVIARVNDKAIDSRETLVATIRSYMPGQEVTLAVRRGDVTLEKKAKLVGGVGTGARAEMMNEMGGPLSLRNANFPAVLQHDTVLTPAMCGGPLVTLDGKAVGVNIARAGRVESYAVPADVIVALLPDLKSGKLAPKSQAAPTTRPAERKNEG